MQSSNTFAQNDVRLGQTFTAFTVIGRGMGWAVGSPGTCTTGGCIGGSIAQNFIFQPISSDSTVCVQVINNNPSNTHALAIRVSETHDPAVTSYNGNIARWFDTQGFSQAGGTSTSQSLSIPANSTLSAAFNTYGAAVIAVRISGTAGAAGNPDTGDVLVTQTKAGNCGSTLAQNFTLQNTQFAEGTVINTAAARIGNLILGFDTSTNQAEVFRIGSFNQGLVLCSGVNPLINGSAVSIGDVLCLKSGTGIAPGFIQVLPWCANYYSATASPGTGTGLRLCVKGSTEFEQQSQLNTAQSWSTFGSLTNPTGPKDVVDLTGTNSSTHHFALFQVRVSCSASCEIRVSTTTARGTTCTAITDRSSEVGITISHDANIFGENNCTGQPTLQATLDDIFIAANTPYTFDYRGWGIMSDSSNGTHGITVQVVGTITGTVNATVEWSQEQ